MRADAARPQAVFDAFSDTIYQKMIQADKTGDETNYLYGKARENAGRVALILAASRKGKLAIIEEADAVYATKLVGYLISEVIEVVRANVSESSDEKAKKRILQIIAMAGRGGILKGELTRRTQWVRRTLRDEYLGDLVESGELVIMPASTCGERYAIRELA